MKGVVEVAVVRVVVVVGDIVAGSVVAVDTAVVGDIVRGSVVSVVATVELVGESVGISGVVVVDALSSVTQ